MPNGCIRYICHSKIPQRAWTWISVTLEEFHTIFQLHLRSFSEVSASVSCLCQPCQGFGNWMITARTVHLLRKCGCAVLCVEDSTYLPEVPLQGNSRLELLELQPYFIHFPPKTCWFDPTTDSDRNSDLNRLIPQIPHTTMPVLRRTFYVHIEQETDDRKQSSDLNM